jgi:hypothetical protein
MSAERALAGGRHPPVVDLVDEVARTCRGSRPVSPHRRTGPRSAAAGVPSPGARARRIGRRRASERRVDARREPPRDSPAEDQGWPRGRGKSPARPGRASGDRYSAPGSYSAISMNRARSSARHGGSRRGSPRPAPVRRRSSGGPGTRFGSTPAPSTSRSPGPTGVWPPRSTGIASRTDARQRPATTDRIRSGSSRSLADGSLRTGPAPLVRAEPVGERDPGCRPGRRRRARSAARRALGAVAVEQEAEAGADRALLRRACPEAALLDRGGSGTRCGLSSQAGPGGGAAGDERSSRDASFAVACTPASAARRAGTSGLGGRGVSRVGRASSGWRPGAGSRPGPPAIPEVADGDTGALEEPRQPVVGRGRAAPRGPVPATAIASAVAAVVREGRARGTRGRRQNTARQTRRQGQAAGAGTTTPSQDDALDPPAGVAPERPGEPQLVERSRRLRRVAPAPVTLRVAPGPRARMVERVRRRARAVDGR